ncbi:MAG: VWA domain-containing protein [Nitrospina sp.]|jgi:hypothetical protein|nr:VWA domain-containing protein [Nitrospina sp.]MBT5633688.1 VWA domain-containing protein [Nitrospina sp.]
MYGRFLIYLFSFLTLLFTSEPSWAEKSQEIEIIVDGSGSMAGKMEGSTKLAIAKQSLAKIVNEIPPGSQVALRVYGQNFSVDEKEQSCQDSELIYPMGPIDSEVLTQKIQSIKAKAYTPIAFSLAEAGKDFLAKDNRFIMLVSDGIETCGGDPCQVARDIQTTGAPLVIHSIGFDVDEKAREQLVCIAEVSGGKYFDAKDAKGLFTSLQTIAKQELKPVEPMTQAELPLEEPQNEEPKFLAPPKKTRFGEWIRGGRYYEDAIPLKPGKYRIDHDLRQGEYDYFKISLNNGQKLRIQYTTQDEGSGCAGAAIHSKDRLKLLSNYIVYKSSTGETDLEVFDLEKAPVEFYVLIGSTCQGVQSKDTMLDIFIEDRFDGGSGQEAGPKLKKPLPIKPGKHEENWLQLKSDVDTFVVTGKPGKELHVKVLPESEIATLKFSLYNEDRERLLYAQAKNNGAVVKGKVLVSEDYPEIYIQVSGFNATKYSLKIQSREPKK